MPRVIRAVVTAALVAAPASPALAVRADPGWPVVGLAGDLMPGPRDGVVEAKGIDPGIAVNAWTPAGVPMWSVGETRQCGNCDWHVPRGPLADGSYGPFGFSADGSPATGLKAVSATGVTGPGCAGAVVADGGCIAEVINPTGGSGAWPVTVSSTRAGTVLWTYTDPSATRTYSGGRSWIVQDREGLVYALIPAQTGRVLLVLDGTTGALRARITGDAAPLYLHTGLASGALGQSAAGLVSIGPDGATRWTAPFSTPSVIADPALGRAYVATGAGATVRTRALDLVNGAVLWNGENRPMRALSPTADGVLMAFNDSPVHYQLQGRGTDGKVRWSRLFPGEIVSATPDPSGHVFVSQRSLNDPDRGLITRFDPALAPRRGRGQVITVTRRPQADCAAVPCRPGRGEGVLVRFRSDRPLYSLRWTFDAAPVRRPHWWAGILDVPMGDSTALLTVPPAAAKKTMVLGLRWRVGYSIRTRTIRIPVPR